MRYADGHKEAVRETIVVRAARALRREGLSAVSVPDLMKEAGLTHGAFYGHFKDRDALVAEAVMAAANQTAARVLSQGPGALKDTLAAYLSAEHVNHPEEGCVLAALGSEGRTQAAPVREAFARAARGFLDLVQRTLPRRARHDRPSDEALATASRMVGAIVLARLVDDDALARRIMAAARAA